MGFIECSTNWHIFRNRIIDSWTWSERRILFLKKMGLKYVRYYKYSCLLMPPYAKYIHSMLVGHGLIISDCKSACICNLYVLYYIHSLSIWVSENTWFPDQWNTEILTQLYTRIVCNLLLKNMHPDLGLMLLNFDRFPRVTSHVIPQR